MRFKPLVSVEELQQAEAEIAAEARSALPAKQFVESAHLSSGREDRPHLRPEPRFEPLVAGQWVRFLALFGMKAGVNRVETVNRIARTVALGCDAGLYDPARQGGGREFSMAMKLRAAAADPKTPNSELPVILGWVQALVAMGCKGMTPERARAA